MSTIQHKLDAHRRLERPDWAVNNQQLAKVLATAMEGRAGFAKRNCTGTPAERIKRAQVAIKAQLPRKIEILDRLCKEYVELKKNPAATYRRKRELETEIEGLDTCINANQKDGGLGQLVGCVQTYFREGLNSVECAERLHIKPPLVRVTIYRLNKAAEAVKSEVRVSVSMRVNMLRGLRTNPVAVPGKHQRQCWVCGALFYPAANGEKRGVCSKRCRVKRICQVAKAKRLGLKPPPKYFCGPACKDTARFAVKSLPVPTKPGVGLFVPIAGGDRYQNYLKFCLCVGAAPMPEPQWRMDA